MIPNTQTFSKIIISRFFSSDCTIFVDTVCILYGGPTSKILKICFCVRTLHVHLGIDVAIRRVLNQIVRVNNDFFGHSNEQKTNKNNHVYFIFSSC